MQQNNIHFFAETRKDSYLRILSSATVHCRRVEITFTELPAGSKFWRLGEITGGTHRSKSREEEERRLSLVRALRFEWEVAWGQLGWTPVSFFLFIGSSNCTSFIPDTPKSKNKNNSEFVFAYPSDHKKKWLKFSVMRAANYFKFWCTKFSHLTKLSGYATRHYRKQ